MGIYREYFSFTRSERNGIIVLLLIIICLLISIQILPYISSNNKVDYSSFEKEIDSFMVSVQSQDSLISMTNEPALIPEYFSFNPNIVSETELIQMGIPRKVIRNWLNYISKGGKFIAKEDVQKIWGLEDSVYKKIESYIEIPEKEKKTYTKDENSQAWVNLTKGEYQNSNKKDNSIELNSADSTGLCGLPGIGPGFSKRILKYRDLLGGYVKKEQLLEVFGFTPEMYSKIEHLVFVEANTVKKINLNTADFKQMIRHPYFNKDIVNKVLEYRRIQIKIVDVQDLVKDKMLSQDQCDKIKPYIEL